MSTDQALANRAAYDRWADSYPPLPHNALMLAEQSAMLELLPPMAGQCALDLACGTGRYSRLLAQRGASSVIACDFSPGMLGHASPALQRVRADMMYLPFRTASFDLVLAGLAVGHAPDLGRWLEGVAAVLKPGGHLLYSDFHPDAARAGMTRSFVDTEQRLHVLQHRAYELLQHREAATAAGFEMESLIEVRPGEGHGLAFDAKPAIAQRWPGLALVLAVRLRKRELA
ncbi:class I SAM-dependent methyltransferase [Pelomonas sp. V22]|uniref:class I SAM-dependent methyltransferase n=1 Tax=Pelomonas sp. V22 TaxID=2822139 RepID=UPI0024A7B328|nr:class I SAM-dependent methyltransferase [Pelomonas sp. V22]MDI4633402.1 class I SAM-dependent methyltransferase [Pelomonas sp. V22]